jgi:hypothetical protein
MAGIDSKQFEAVMKALQAHDWHVFPAFRPAVYYHTRPFQQKCGQADQLALATHATHATHHSSSRMFTVAGTGQMQHSPPPRTNSVQVRVAPLDGSQTLEPLLLQYAHTRYQYNYNIL